MSINISVNGSPFAVHKRYGVKKTFDDFSKSREFEKRRLMRLQQVREQSKSNSISLRKKVDSEKCRLLSDIEKRGADDLNRWRTQKLINLQKEFDECCEEIGSENAETAVKLVKECRTQEDKENDWRKALERGRVAERRIRDQKSNDQQKIQEANERKKLVRNLENLRSSLVTNIRNKKTQQPAPIKSSTFLPKSTVENVSKRPLRPKRKPLTVKKAVKNTTTESVEECTHVSCEHESKSISGLLREYKELLQKNLDPENFRISDDEWDKDVINPNYDELDYVSDNESTHQPRKTPNTTLPTHNEVADRALSPIQVVNQQSEQIQTSPAICCVCKRGQKDFARVIDEQCQTTLIDDCMCKWAEKVELNNQCICKRAEKKPGRMVENCICRRIKERGEKASNRVQANKHYNRIVEDLPVLQKIQQRNKNVISHQPQQLRVKRPVLHMGPERRREYEHMRQKRMEQMFENENKPPVIANKKSNDDDLVKLIERVNQQKKQLLDDILNLPAESNLENVLDDLSNLVKESDQNSGGREPRGTVPSTRQSIRKKIKYKSIAAQTSFSSRSSSTISVEHAVEISQKVEKSVQIPSVDLNRFVDQSAQVSSDFEKNCKPEAIGRQKVLKVGDVINVCEILVRVREDPRTYVEWGSSKRPRKIVRKKIYRHVSSVISSETSTSYVSPEKERKRSKNEDSNINPKLAHYIQKLLQMPKSKIDQLSCSDIGSRTPSVLSLTDEPPLNSDKIAQTENVSFSGDEKYKELAESCSKRIENLIKRIEQVRQEKSQFLLGSSTSTSTGDSKELSTQYLDPPVYTQPEKAVLVPSVNNGQNKKPPKPPTSTRNGKLLNLVVEPHELSAITEVDSVLNKTLPPTQQDESSVHSESIEKVFNSLGLNWAIPKLKEIREKSSDDKLTSDEQLITPSLSSFDKLVEKILQSISSTTTPTPITTSGDTSNTLVLDSRRSSLSEMPETQRTSTPVPRADEILNFDYRAYFDDISSIKTSSQSNEIHK